MYLLLVIKSIILRLIPGCNECTMSNVHKLHVWETWEPQTLFLKLFLELSRILHPQQILHPLTVSFYNNLSTYFLNFNLLCCTTIYIFAFRLFVCIISFVIFKIYYFSYLIPMLSLTLLDEDILISSQQNAGASSDW